MGNSLFLNFNFWHNAAFSVFIHKNPFLLWTLSLGIRWCRVTWYYCLMDIQINRSCIMIFPESHQPWDYDFCYHSICTVVYWDGPNLPFTFLIWKYFFTKISNYQMKDLALFGCYLYFFQLYSRMWLIFIILIILLYSVFISMEFTVKICKFRQFFKN